ncbi:MAG: hypothetical protein D6682_00275 [Zetaproteobacteria bacterium]|nr:MAG: hypothetical protein D6682_00275 [Zetaproteobacteria bacterium]
MRFSLQDAPPSHAGIKQMRAAIESRLKWLHLFYIFTLYLIPIVTVVACIIFQVHNDRSVSNTVIMSGVLMLAISAAGHAFHFQGYATAMNGMIIVGLSFYTIPVALVMVPAGIILQYKPRAWHRDLADLRQINDERNRNVTEMKLTSPVIGAYAKKVAATGRNYFVRGEYLAMVAQREREIQEHNARARIDFRKPEELPGDKA